MIRSAKLFRRFEHITTTYFGYENVSKTEKQIKVNAVFEKVASNYDLMNDLMSLGLHKLWKIEMVKYLNPKVNEKYLDIAGGTGDIAFEICRNLTSKQDSTILNSMKDIKIVTVSDINQAMLEVGKTRAEHIMVGKFIDWNVENAEKLSYPNDSFDGITIAYGIRNMTNIDKVLHEVHRVLKKGGKFVCMELSHVHNPLFSKLYDAYSFNIIPVLGQIVSNDWNSYQYLVESIRTFYSQNQLIELMTKTGFRFTSYHNFLNGINTIFIGYK